MIVANDALVAAFRAAYDNAILAFCDTKKSARLCRRMDARRWDRGGCTAIAKALLDFFPGELVSLGPDPGRLAHHVMVKTHDIYLDSTGSYTESEILEKWRTYSGHERVDLAPVTSATHLPFSFDAAFISEISAALESYMADAEDRWKILDAKIDLKAPWYVGNCANSFDDAGNCTIDQLPWSTVSDFACAAERALTVAEFSIEPELRREIGREELAYSRTKDGVLIAYDDDSDVHYFFV